MAAGASFARLPSDVVRRVADVLDSGEALALHLATGGGPLAEAFSAANSFRDESALRRDIKDKKVDPFSRWQNMVGPLRCVVADMDNEAFACVVASAAMKGIAALSALDVSRLDVAHRVRLRPRAGMPDQQKTEIVSKLVKDLPGGEEMWANEETRDRLLAVAGAQLGKETSIDSFYDSAIQRLVNRYVEKKLGSSSPAWCWISRYAHSIITAGDITVLCGSWQLVSDSVLCLHLKRNPDWMPREGQPNFTSVIERNCRKPLQPCDDPASYRCDVCLATGAADDHGRPVAYACKFCCYAVCETCATAAGATDHDCKARTRDVETDVGYIASMSAAMSAELITCREPITPETVAANVALKERIVLQRAWYDSAKADRLVARDKLNEGEAAHAAWLEETYRHNPLA